MSSADEELDVALLESFQLLSEIRIKRKEAFDAISQVGVWGD